MANSGLYYWAGPGTARMIKLKFPGAVIDQSSLMTSYDLPVLQNAKRVLGTTDAFVTFSWGFSEKTEKEDYEFVRSKLENFKKAGIATHAYVQGLNLVTSEHNKDFWARDRRGRLLPYHRGRKITCPNNPAFRSYLIKKVSLALNENFDGVFVDNFHYGQIPLRFGNRFSFFGCSCRYCQQRFTKETGSHLPDKFVKGSKELEEYLAFRARVMTGLAGQLANLVHKAGKKFGSNSFDGKLDSRVFTGAPWQELVEHQDYLLFENHDLPGEARNNSHLTEVIKSTKKPVFVVSYQKGIGREPQWSQRQYDRIASEAKLLGYAPCYKGTEYKTNGIWHNLKLKKLRRVQPTKIRLTKFKYRDGIGLSRGLRLVDFLYAPFMTWLFETKSGQKLGTPLYHWALRN